VDIERLQIEGGFLDGFDVKFSSGLNVLIGARGTGKTSVIELIRFALAARNHTAEAAQRSADHATAVLDDGEVTVQLGDVLDNLTVSRSATDESPRAGGTYDKPLIFSQTEIENLGLSESGRLRLLDGFIPDGAAIASEEAAAITAIRSVFKEIRSATDERNSLAAGLEGLNGLEGRIKELETEEAKHRAGSAELENRQRALSEANAIVTDAAVREGVLERFSKAAGDWAASLDDLVLDDFGPEEWDGPDSNDPLAGLRETYKQLVTEAHSVGKRFNNLKTQVIGAREALTKARLEAEAKSRAIRAEIEQSVAGAGAVSRQLAQVRMEVAQLLSKRKLVEDRDQRIRQLRMRRDERIKALETVRLRRYEKRLKIAADLNKALMPQIRVSVERYGQYAEYNKALTEALRGSGMRYNDLVGLVSQSVSPQELIQFVDSNDFFGLSEISAIPKDRAARLLGHLREVGAADIVTVSIEDNVKMSLLDGVDYKDVEVLSAGQRCTVVLSIVLQHTSRTLIIDQPEDHLDNAYIATTVIKAIRNRKGHGQLIISTHNANIPVLGEADLVIEMTSDGRNGFVQVCEKLSSPKAVDAITSVMEGGREAFASRAAFYERHEA
jgi:DNA repair exonuclease SbcCD ATPase subunit